MAKEFNYNYYGIDTTVWPSNGENIAKMVKGNTWNYYSSEGNPIAETFGKPFDDSVAIWRLMPDASFACPGYIYVRTGNTLQAEFKVNQNENSVPLIMQATDTSDNYTTYPHYRIADNYTNNEKLVYSRLCYDINPQKYCLMPQAILWDRTADTNNSSGGIIYRSLGSVAGTVNSNNNYKIVTLRAFMYFGGEEAPRSRDGQYLTTNLLYPTQIQQPCAPMAEPYAYRPLPNDADMIKRMKYMFSSTEHPDWTTDKVFNPFNHSGGAVWYSTLSAPTSNDTQYNIGVLRSWTRNQIQQGANSIPDTGGKITGQWIYCNFGNKVFDDVAYHWRSYVWDAEHKAEISNGLPLTQINGASYIRLVTELVIDDRKGRTLGEATANAMKHEIAYIGFYFGDDSSRAANSVLGDQGTGEGIYLPKRVDGIPNGEYYTGEDLVNSDEAKQTNTEDWVNKGDINPITGDEGDWSNQQHLRIGPDREGGPTYWVLDLDEFKEFINKVNKSVPKLNKPKRGDYATDEEFEAALDVYYKDVQAYADETLIQWGGTNAWEYVVCSKWYPMRPDDLMNTNHDTIKISQVDTHVEADYLYTKTKLWDMGEFNIEQRYYNWRDYKCEITLMLPFIGSIQLDPKLYVGHTVNVKYAIDWITANCTAYIYRDGVMMDSADGIIGMDLPLSLASAGSYQAAIGEYMLAKRQARRELGWQILSTLAITFGGETLSYSGVDIGQITGGRTQGVSGVVNAFRNLRTLTETVGYKIEHTALHFGEVGSASPINSFIQDWRTRLLITYPSIDYTNFVSEENYAHTQGYACCMQLPSLLNNDKFECKGYTVVGAIDLSSIGCTETEAESIRGQLQSGVYINM